MSFLRHRLAGTETKTGNLAQEMAAINPFAEKKKKFQINIKN